MNSMNFKIAATAIALGLAATACDPSIEGGEGNLVFSYDSGPVPVVDSTPLAKNASLDYTAKTAGDNGQAVTFESAESSTTSVIEVTASNNAVTANALEIGSSEISVVADGPDGKIEDFFEAEVVEADGMEINHLCTENDDDPAAYLPGQEVSLKYRMLDTNRTVAGYGYYPVSVTPDTAATVKENAQMGLMDLTLADTAGTATIDSDISDASFTLDTIEESNIDGAQMWFENINLPVLVDDTRLVFIFPTASGVLGLTDPVTICQAQNDMNVSVDTPDTCSAEVVTDFDFDGSFLNPYERRAIELTGVAEGDCQYTVTFPDADGGSGYSEQFTTEVQVGNTDS
ncbi:MAG: hypothetical protein ACQEVA_16315 [Myxococcota bacterium]